MFERQEAEGDGVVAEEDRKMIDAVVAVGKFYRRGSQEEKTSPSAAGIPLASSHLIELGVFLMGSRHPIGPLVQQFWFSFAAVFITLRDEANRSETHKQNGC